MYRKWLKISFIICYFILENSSYSQLKTDTLKVFTKEEIFSNNTTFTSLDLLDSNSYFLSLKQILESSSPVYVKNYGKGQLATLSIRGNGASQTQLFWNGFKMNSPTLGQSDLSLIPLFFISKVKLNYSGASSMDGSGGIGGSLQLSNKLRWKKGIHGEFIQEFSSFTNFKTGVGVSYGNRTFFHQLKILHQKGKNDFEFVDISKKGQPKGIQENNKLIQLGAQYELGVQLNNKNLIQSTFLYFDSYRELPPIIGGVSNQEIQEDKNFKSFVSWKSYQSKFKSDLRLSFFQESLRYTDSVSAIYSLVKVKTYQGQYRFNFNLLKKIKMEAAAQSAYSEVGSNGFDSNKTRNESGVYVKASQGIRKLSYELFARQEIVENKISPLVYGVGLKYALGKRLGVKGNCSTNYRLPTLNDLYWNPGGNENLNPERGWTTEVGFEFKKPVKIHSVGKKGFGRIDKSVTFNITGFYNQTNNWIQWQPTDFGYWQPVNLKSIENKGVEASIKYKRKNKMSTFVSNFFYTYTDSKNIALANGSEKLKGKQTSYVPKHKANFFISYSIKNLKFTYSQIYNSRVFIDAGNSSYLPHYFPANIGVGYLLRYKKININLGFNVINLYNEPYHAVANRAIPGRNYSLTLKLNF